MDRGKRNSNNEEVKLLGHGTCQLCGQGNLQAVSLPALVEGRNEITGAEKLRQKPRPPRFQQEHQVHFMWHGVHNPHIWMSILPDHPFTFR